MTAIRLSHLFARRSGLRPAFLAAAVVALTGADAAAQLNLNSRQGNNQPIEISSDTLEVQQDKQLAIFKGKVDVVQGDTRLRSEELFVYYRDRNAPAAGAAAGGTPPRQQPAARPAAAPAAPGTPDSSSISKIEAKGSVFVSTPKERAQGDFGVYDVEKRTITLTGNVLMTSDNSTLVCARAVMYQDTGRSTCDPAQGTRVRAVIIPEGGEKPATPTPAPAPGARR
ncbi:LptA/OstA family protein [Ferrovibrio terrae]|uniref:LptA/OstA family protein n=1 Tax=Ferrovibrio terrae TaxID=2594003 RepID=UPI0031382D02